MLYINYKLFYIMCFYYMREKEIVKNCLFMNLKIFLMNMKVLKKKLYYIFEQKYLKLISKNDLRKNLLIENLKYI